MPVHGLNDLKGGDDDIPEGAMAGPVDGEKASKWFMSLYHEKQIGGLCAVHCINNLLQGPIFNEIQLAEIGADLDRRERAAMQGSGLESESMNVRADGFFSVQVIQTALQKKGLQSIPIGSEEAKGVLQNPTKEVGFILNRSEHWFCLRKLGSYWFDLNSTQEKPKFVSDTYLGMLISQMKADGYSVFVVRGGMFPSCKAEQDRKGLEAVVAALQSGPSGQQKPAASASVSAFSGAGFSLAAPSATTTAANVQEALMASGVDANADPELAAAIAESLKAAAPAPALDPAEEMRRKRLARFGG